MEKEPQFLGKPVDNTGSQLYKRAECPMDYAPWFFNRKAASSMNRPKASPRYSRQAGQNLVELALTLPFVIVMIFFIIETGRAWMAYEGAKMAAREGAYVASLYHNAKAGQDQLDYKLNAAGLTVKTAKVTQVPGQHAYASDVTVTFQPLFGSMKIATMTGTISILPSQFDLSYKSITDVSVY
jgi:Flp pilus assembly protein TadG